ncbi:MAG: choice-of-anchor J domain-containing protein [Bacteroidales bacterium]|nr:choice-of-anchor J domain-containing protein [Bacteroidales bacterium]
MKKAFFWTASFLLTSLLFLNSCVKDKPDEPPSTLIPFDPDKVLTIGEIKQMYIENGGAFTFDEPYSVFAKVGMDDKSGNIYKSAFIQDESGGIQLNFLFTGGLIVGDSVRIMLQGGEIELYHELYQVNNLEITKNAYKIKPRMNLEPKLLTIQQLISNIDLYQSTVIRLEDVQFNQGELGQTFADAVNLIDINRTLEDCDGGSLIVRTSGYANFAADTLPPGRGSLIAIASVYNNDVQLVIRQYSEVQLTGERCGSGGEPIDPVPSVNEDFETANDNQNINFEGWTNIIVAGNRMWQGKYFSNDDNTYAQATGYNSGLDDMETWLITPPVINTNGDKILSFKAGMAFWAHTVNEPLKVLASTDYDGTNFESATWTPLSPTLPNSGSGNYNWVPSGDIPLSGFVGNVAIAFKYKGSDSETTSSTLDDIVVNTAGGSGSTVLYENFDDNWGNWETISVVGAQVWDRDNNFGPDGSPCARISGYSSGSHANDDWLISPAIDLSGFSLSTLVFESARNYDGDDIIVKISTDYSGDPATASWSILSANLSQGSWIWTSSGNVDISDYAGQTVYIAFQYVSTNELSATWEVDNIEVKADE